MGDSNNRSRQLVHRLRRLGRGLGGDSPAPASAPGPQPASAPSSRSVEFLHEAYAKDNGDVAQSFGQNDARALKDHFDRYGRHESRGVKQQDYINIEGVVCCDDGHFFIAGWADRRIVPKMDITIEVGYLRHMLGQVDACWYQRGDVTKRTGDSTRPGGFGVMIHVPDLPLHSHVRVLINGQLAFEEKAMRWRSVDQFLSQTLTSCAAMADQPVGSSLGAAEKMYAAFQKPWQHFLDGITFAQAFEHRGDDPVEQSIIIAIYQKADMLIAQLETLAEMLKSTATEVIVVGNDLREAPRIVDQLNGFCQIHDIRLRLFLCSGNSGFSAANNFGADVARGETLIFMNPDIFPPEDTPETALAFVTSDPGDGLTGALLYYGDGLLMHSGMYVASDLAVDAQRGRSEPVLRVEHFGKGLGHFIDDDKALLEPVMAPIRDRKLLVTAALWKIRKSLFVDMGGLSTDYLFAYYEDADFCLRLLEAGHPIRVDETARWIHMEGVGKANPPFVRSFMWLNRGLFTRRFAESDLVSDGNTDLYQL